MSIPRKKGCFRKIFGKPFVYDVIIAIAAAWAAIYKGKEFFQADKTVATDKTEAKVFFISAGVVFIFTVAKNVVAWATASKQESTHELDGCLHTLHQALLLTLPNIGDTVLRITIHVPIKDGQKLEQVTNYVIDYDETKKTAGRIIPSQSGIAGKSFRTKQALQAVRVEEDYEKYIQELVTVWNYVDADARKCNPATKSWFVIPLLETANNQNVEGVIYCDCNKKDFFSTERQQIAINAASGIAKFIGKRYST